MVTTSFLPGGVSNDVRSTGAILAVSTKLGMQMARSFGQPCSSVSQRTMSGAQPIR